MERKPQLMLVRDESTKLCVDIMRLIGKFLDIWSSSGAFGRDSGLDRICRCDSNYWRPLVCCIAGGQVLNVPGDSSYRNMNMSNDSASRAVRKDMVSCEKFA